MIIALEGTDGVGKTTFARQLAASTGGTYIHAGPPTRDTWRDEYVAPLHNISGPVVLDRWHLGEIVWPLIWGRRSLFSCLDDFKLCCEALADLDVFLAVVVRNEDSIAETLAERGESGTVEDTLRGQLLYQLLARTAADCMATEIFQSDQLMEQLPWN